jgi:hypothetical protein
MRSSQMVMMTLFLTQKFKTKALRTLSTTRKKNNGANRQASHRESNNPSASTSTRPIADIVRTFFSSSTDNCIRKSCDHCHATRNKPGETTVLIPAWPNHIDTTFISRYASAKCQQCYVFWVALSSMSDSIPVGSSVGYVGRLSITIGRPGEKCHHFTLCSTSGRSCL